MSSLQRSRSLRKPTTASTITTTDTESRNDSPSRLPTVKPLGRSNTMAGTTRTLRSGATALSRSTSVRQSAAVTEPPKRELSRYPPSTTTTRQRPVARPTSADGQASMTRKPPTHTRARSTTTGMKGTGISRPPSQESTRGSSTTTATATATATRTLRSGSTTTHDRLANAPTLRPHSRESARSSTTSRTLRSGAQATQDKLGNAATAHAPRLRPAFSTLQQHYSPAKSTAPKPLTSTYLAPPSPSKLPANVAASAETSRLQTELLQLCLLHRDAAGVDAEWRASAEKKLGDRFAQLARTGRGINEREKAEVEKENVLALRKWAVGGGLEERIQTLDVVVNSVWTLGESGGRYARVVRRFERWVDRMCEIEEARRDDGAYLQESDVIFIGELDTAWKDECTGLVRRLDTLKRQLEDLGEFPSQEEENDERPSLHRMVEDSRILVQGMLTELSLMEDIEREAMAREDEWIERMNREDDSDDTPRAGAIWRVV